MPHPNRHKLHFGPRSLATLSLALLCGCGSSGPFASSDQSAVSISKLDSDAVPPLRKLPHVVQVLRHGPKGQPTHRIIHIADWHFVERDAYAADLKGMIELTPDAKVTAPLDLPKEYADPESERICIPFHTFAARTCNIFTSAFTALANARTGTAYLGAAAH